MDEFTNYKLLEIGSYSLKVASVLAALFFITFVFLVLKIIKKAIYRAKHVDETKKYTINKLIKYLIYVISLVIILQILGFNISVILAGSAALLVGIGLGMKEIFGDFLSGIIILIEGNIKIDDVVEVNGMICKVKEINLRTTTVYGRNENFIVLPNTEITRGKVINWTLNNVSARFSIDVGVAYASDVDQVIEILTQVATSHPKVLKHKVPFTRFEEYGDSSLNFGIYFWTNDIFTVEFTKSDIRINAFKALKKNGIEIPFPQRVVHIKN